MKDKPTPPKGLIQFSPLAFNHDDIKNFAESAIEVIKLRSMLDRADNKTLKYTEIGACIKKPC